MSRCISPGPCRLKQLFALAMVITGPAGNSQLSPNPFLHENLTMLRLAIVFLAGALIFGFGGIEHFSWEGAEDPLPWLRHSRGAVYRLQRKSPCGTYSYSA